VARRRRRRRNPSPPGHWGAKIAGFLFGGLVPGVVGNLLLPAPPAAPELLPFDPTGENARALAFYEERRAHRARLQQAIDVAAAIGAFVGTYRVTDPTGQGFLLGASVGCLTRAASRPIGEALAPSAIEVA
jgi:hypothetical protein